jgi:hypothetical protein
VSRRFPLESLAGWERALIEDWRTRETIFSADAFVGIITFTSHNNQELIAFFLFPKMACVRIA